LALLALALLGASFASLSRLRVDLSLIPLLEASAEARAEVEAFNRMFPDRRVDVPLVLQWPGPIGRAELVWLEAFERRLAAVPHVADVYSAASARYVELIGTGLQPRRFMDLDPGQTALDRARRHPLFLGRLVSLDGRAVTVLMTYDLELGDPRRGAVLRQIETLVGGEVALPVRARLLGGDVVQRVMSRYILRDMARSVGIEAAVFAFLLPLLFRTFRGMILPLLTVNAAMLFNFGWMVLTGEAVTALGVAIPGLIVVICLCDAIHMMHRFEEAMAAGRDKQGAIIEMLANVGQACLYTSLTTALGFLSLLIAPHGAVRDFARSASIGVAIAFLTVMTVLPLQLSFWPTRRGHAEGLAFLTRLAYGRPRLAWGLFVLGVVGSVFGIGRIVVDSSWLGELPEQEAVVQDLRWYEAHFSGLLQLEARLEGSLEEPTVFRAVERLKERLLEEDGITDAESYTDWAAEMAGAAPPLDDEQIQRGMRLLRLAGPDFPRHLLTEDFHNGRMIFHTRDVGTRRYTQLREILEAEAEALPPGLQAAAAGFSRMAYESSHLVVTTMMRSLMLSLLAISFFMMLAYRSVRLGLIALLPNAFPILAALGLTGWLGIPLRIGIVMVYCAGVGLAVDDGIHLITRFLQEGKRDPTAPAGRLLRRSLRTTGRALVITSVVLAVGALSYLPSAFRSISDVGVLLTAIILIALMADLFLLPLLLERFAPLPRGETSPRPVEEPTAPAARTTARS